MRALAIVEGISYLLLFGFSMPLKYWANIREPNIYIGYVHGGLFIAFIILAFVFCRQQGWGMKRNLKFFLASLLPYGTFYMDKKYLAPLVSEKK
ncbi:putative membrane protein YdzA [Muriicola marianensis]|uniref:Membrane protein YdzA n=2 Tax=Muriicola marianensis TaxID=1324801 RepID=A0ABQ1QRG7_9FLAO|nr:putative membrane protein YdzA [Muriicola marianensis]